MQEICPYFMGGIPEGMLQKSVAIFLDIDFLVFFWVWAFEDRQLVEFEHGNAPQSNFHNPDFIRIW